MTSSSSFPYLFWGILLSCWLRFELNQPPSKTHYLWQNCGRMWLSMFSPLLEVTKKPRLWIGNQRTHRRRAPVVGATADYLASSWNILLKWFSSCWNPVKGHFCEHRPHSCWFIDSQCWNCRTGGFAGSMGMKWNKTIRAGFCWTKPSRLKRFEMHWHLCFNAWPTFGKVFTVVQQKFGGLVTVLLLLQPSSLHELERQIDFTCFDG